MRHLWLLLAGLLIGLLAGPCGAETKWYDQIDVGLSTAALVQATFNVDKALSAKSDENRSYGAVSLDLDFSRRFSPQDKAYVLLEMGSGSNPEQDISSFSGIVDEALSMVPVATDDGQVRISEAWYEHSFVLSTGELRVRLGKVDLTTDFDTNAYANDECAQFISPVFINNLAVEFPDYGFGSMAWFETDKASLGLGYAEAQATWEELFDYPFLIAELDLRPRLFNRPGNYRFYAWFNGARHPKLNAPGVDSGYGFGLSFDQEVADGLGVFVRYGWQDGEVYKFDNALSGGVSLAGKFWGRENDTLALGVGVVFLSGDYESQLKNQGIDPGDEYHVEAYYSYQVSAHLTITPDVQWTDNPSGYKDYDSFWVFSTRVTWDF